MLVELTDKRAADACHRRPSPCLPILVSPYALSQRGWMYFTSSDRCFFTCYKDLRSKISPPSAVHKESEEAWYESKFSCLHSSIKVRVGDCCSKRSRLVKNAIYRLKRSTEAIVITSCRGSQALSHVESPYRGLIGFLSVKDVKSFHKCHKCETQALWAPPERNN